MRITLAVPHGTQQPGDPIELDDAEARQMIADGHARPFDPDEQPEQPEAAPLVGAYTASDLAASLVDTFAPKPTESVAAPALTPGQITRADRDTLRGWCGDRGLGTGGNAATMRARLTATLTDSGPLATTADPGDDPEEA